jgi:hypothetical protein
MRKSGGIIAIIAGIMGIIASIATFIFGSIVVATGGEHANIVSTMVWNGILCSFLSIILGAICLNAKRRLVGILLIISSLCGMGLLTGTSTGIFIQLCMLLSLVGGFLAAIGKTKTPKSHQGEPPLA